MSDTLTIVVSPGGRASSDLARVAGAAVVLDPSFWPARRGGIGHRRAAAVRKRRFTASIPGSES